MAAVYPAGPDPTMTTLACVVFGISGSFRRTTCVQSESRTSCRPAGLEYDMADSGVRCRHRVEAVRLFHVVIERAAHDQPHHHLDTFGARFAHIVDMRDPGEGDRILGEVVQEIPIPLAV